MREVLTYTCSKEAASLTQQLLLKENTDCISFEVEGNEKLLSCIALFMRNEAGQVLFQRQLGTGENPVVLSSNRNACSYGGIPCTLTKGVYTVELVPFGEVLPYILEPMKITIVCQTGAVSKRNASDKQVWMDLDGNLSGYDPDEMKRHHTGWYRGDFHCHTVLSDGHEEIEKQMFKAKLMNLDFYYATEHNLVPSSWCKTDLTVLCGIEITTQAGHANIFGLRRRPSDCKELYSDYKHAQKQLVNALAEVKKDNCLISINHPFLTPWAWLYGDMPIEDIDCIEVINDPTFPDNHEANRKAVALIDRLWADGWHVCGIGGSDTHALLHEWYTPDGGPSIVGDPTTSVYCRGLSENSVVSALRRCNAVITRHCQMKLDLRINGKEVIVGEEVTESGMIEIDVKLRHVDEPFMMYVVRDGIVEKVESTYDADYLTLSMNVKMPWSADGYHWLRIGAENGKHDCVLYTNPIYCGSKEHAYHTFQEAGNGLF